MIRSDWERELERLHPASFGWALACCAGDREEARDVLQTAYLKVLDGRARFDGASRPKTWLFSVIRRTAAGRRRSGVVRRLLLGDRARRETAPAQIANPHSSLEASERAKRLRAALGQISERQRQVLELVFYHDMTIEQAAGVMEVGLGSARTHYERGKRSLLKALSGERR